MDAKSWGAWALAAVVGGLVAALLGGRLSPRCVQCCQPPGQTASGDSVMFTPADSVMFTAGDSAARARLGSLSRRLRAGEAVTVYPRRP